MSRPLPTRFQCPAPLWWLLLLDCVFLVAVTVLALAVAVPSVSLCSPYVGLPQDHGTLPHTVPMASYGWHLSDSTCAPIDMIPMIPLVYGWTVPVSQSTLTLFWCSSTRKRIKRCRHCVPVAAALTWKVYCPSVDMALYSSILTVLEILLAMVLSGKELWREY